MRRSRDSTATHYERRSKRFEPGYLTIYTLGLLNVTDFSVSLISVLKK